MRAASGRDMRWSLVDLQMALVADEPVDTGPSAVADLDIAAEDRAGESVDPGDLPALHHDRIVEGALDDPRVAFDGDVRSDHGVLDHGSRTDHDGADELAADHLGSGPDHDDTLDARFGVD